MKATKKTASSRTVKAAEKKAAETTAAVKAAEKKAAETVKKVAEAAPAVKAKTEEKAAEVKTAAKKTADSVKKAAADTRAAAEETVKTVEKKAATVRKTAAKAAAKATAPDQYVSVQYAGKDIDVADLFEKAKKDWTDEFGKKASELKKINLYVNTDDNAAYYVLNDDVKGQINL